MQLWGLSVGQCWGLFVVQCWGLPLGQCWGLPVVFTVYRQSPVCPTGVLIGLHVIFHCFSTEVNVQVAVITQHMLGCSIIWV